MATEEEDNEDGEETVVEKEVLGEVTEEITEVGVNTEAEAEVKDHKERDKNSPKESKSTRKLKLLQLPKVKHKSDHIDLTNSLINWAWSLRNTLNKFVKTSMTCKFESIETLMTF